MSRGYPPPTHRSPDFKDSEGSSTKSSRYPANLNSTRIVGAFLGSVAALSGISTFSIECIGSGFNQVTRHEPGETGVSRLGTS